ncbi:Membrane dipeptidase [compost metagenome]
MPGFISEAVRASGAARGAEMTRLSALNPGDPAAVKAGMEVFNAANPQPRATIDDVVAHIQHVRDVAGIDHVGLGGDFDGVDSLPAGVESVEAYPRILAELMRRGWSEADIRKISGENLLRTMRAVERAATAERGQRPNLTQLPNDGAPE